MVLAVYAAIALPVFALFWLAGRSRWRRPDRGRAASVPAARRLMQSKWITETPIQLLGTGVLLFLALGVFVPRHVPMDFGLAAIALFGFLLSGALLFRTATPWLVRLGLYVGGAFMIYLADHTHGTAGAGAASGLPVELILNLFFGVMAVLVVVSIQLSRDQPFQLTPLDFLMVLAVLTVPNLPEMQMGGYSLGGLAAKIIVLFFAYELILSQLSQRMAQYGLVSLWVFLALGIRAWVHL
jgi:UDP-GlcNAc:undecaprenyl-phosphate GlcNAc-1-phosphate transferase